MSWFSKISNALVSKVESKVVKSRVEDLIDKVDDKAIMKLAETFGQGMMVTTKGITGMVLAMLQDNKYNIANWAGENVHTMIKADEFVKQFLTDMKTDKNKELIKNFTTTISEVAKTFNDQIEKDLVVVNQDMVNTMAEVGKPFGYEQTNKIYFILKEDENGDIKHPHQYYEVTKSRYDLRQVSNRHTKKYDGKSYHTKVGNKVYETTPHKSTEQFYSDLGINPDKLDV